MKTTTKRSIAIAAALALTGTAGIAMAQPGKWQAKDQTRAEVQAKTAQMFQKMDVNGDGTLDQADREAMRAKMFDRLDADGNGSISRAEFDAARGKMREGRGKMRAENGDAEGKRMGRHRRGGHHGMRGMTMMKAADTDNDGAISQAEFTTAALARFDAADADNNGTVTAAERKAAFEQMRAMRKDRRTAGDAS